jgi:hypothetical protein
MKSFFFRRISCHKPRGGLDLGVIAVNKRARVALPVPEAITATRGIHAIALTALPTTMRVSGLRLTGKPTATGVFEFEVQFTARARSGRQVETQTALRSTG